MEPVQINHRFYYPFSPDSKERMGKLVINDNIWFHASEELKIPCFLTQRQVLSAEFGKKHKRSSHLVLKLTGLSAEWPAFQSMKGNLAEWKTHNRKGIRGQQGESSSKWSWEALLVPKVGWAVSFTCGKMPAISIHHSGHRRVWSTLSFPTAEVWRTGVFPSDLHIQKKVELTEAAFWAFCCYPFLCSCELSHWDPQLRENCVAVNKPVPLCLLLLFLL